MNPENFIRTLYLGDRYCTRITIENQKKEIKFYVNLISRIRSESGQWDFYADEDIENGVIVFSGVEQVFFDKSGFFPNDEIYNIEVTNNFSNKYEFTINTSFVDTSGLTRDLIIKIIAKEIYLLDPNRPDMKITS
jgi:hypothetical protein